MAKWNENQHRLAREWYAQALVSEQLHIAAHHRCGRLNFIVGIPVVVVTATTGTAFFASLGKSLNTTLAVTFGLVSILSSVLAALQTFLRFAERSEQHRISAARYRNTAREIEHVLAMPSLERADAISLMEAWRKEFASLAENSPAIPPLKKDGEFPSYPEGTACAAIFVKAERPGPLDRFLANWRRSGRRRDRSFEELPHAVVGVLQEKTKVEKAAEPWPQADA